MVEHLEDQRYCATCQVEDVDGLNYQVGTICLYVVRDKLRCAYLSHLEPGGTRLHSVNSSNWVPENTTRFIRGEVQGLLHDSPHFYEPDELAEW